MNAEPTLQLAQAEVPPKLYVFGAQIRQIEAPTADAVPAAHIAQPAAFAVPLLVTVPAKPDAQVVHEAAELLPGAFAVVVMPKGHGTQPEALAVPGFWTVP
jgi:hypothetical protein